MDIPKKFNNRKLLPLTPKLAILASSFVMSLLIIEIGIRIYQKAADIRLFNLPPQRTTLRFYDNKIFGSALIPNHEGWFVPHTKEYFTWVEVNSDGWPDIEHPVKKPENTFRIVILGDSFVENTQVALENRFFRKLEKMLNEKLDKTIEIIAVGRGNTGTAQQYLILKNEINKYEPDLVIHMFLTANDIKNNSQKLQGDPYLPYYELDGGELKLIPHKLRNQRKAARVKEALKKARIVELLLQARQKYFEYKKHIKFDGFPLEYHVYEKDWSPDYQNAWELTKALIRVSRHETNKMGADYILVTLSNNEQVHKSVWEELKNTYPEMKNKEFDLEKPDKKIIDFCEKENLTCWQMLDTFKNYVKENPNKNTHNRLEGHWNQLGSDLAAKFLFENLLENYFTIK